MPRGDVRRFGWYAEYITARSAATPAVQAEVEHAVQAYAERVITAQTLSERLYALLRVRMPVTS